MSTVTAAVIGTGPDPENPSVEGFAMGYAHAEGYASINGCDLVACADVVPENASAFADRFDLPDSAVFEDYGAMIDEVEPDVVSVTVPPAIHADIVIGCARAGVDAIHCEKPMALTWGGAREMATECWRRDVRLTFNHQRRFGQPFRDTQAMIEDGEIGDLQRVVFMWGNLYDQGTHAIDMCNKFNGETPAEWILAGLDYRDEDVRFGTHNENQIVGHWRYENGVHGLAATDRGEDLYPGTWYVEGTDGAISVDLPDYAVDVRRAGETDWTRTSYEREDLVTLAVEDVVSAYREGRASELRAENALNATEIIFGGYESVRRRGRVDFPLEIDDNPLEEMVESGALTPEPADDAE